MSKKRKRKKKTLREENAQMEAEHEEFVASLAPNDPEWYDEEIQEKFDAYCVKLDNKFEFTLKPKKYDGGWMDYKNKMYKDEQAKATAHEKWETLWKMSSDWYVEPQSYDTWNGCVDVLCAYFRDSLHDSDTHKMTIDEIDEFIEKVKKKFKS